MDIVLAITFASQQYRSGVLNGEQYHQRLLELLEEAADAANANELMLDLALFITSKP